MTPKNVIKVLFEDLNFKRLSGSHMASMKRRKNLYKFVGYGLMVNLVVIGGEPYRVDVFSPSKDFSGWSVQKLEDYEDIKFSFNRVELPFIKASLGDDVRSDLDEAGWLPSETGLNHVLSYEMPFDKYVDIYA